MEDRAVPAEEALRSLVLAQQRHSSRAGPDDEQRKAETSARSQLAKKIAALPPSAVVSRDALAAFKQQHVAMMTHGLPHPGSTAPGMPAVLPTF